MRRWGRAFCPSTRHRIVNPVVAPLAKDDQIRLVQQAFGCDLCFFDVVYDQSFWSSRTCRASVSSFMDQAFPQPDPCGLRKINSNRLGTATPVWVTCSNDSCKMAGIAGARAKTARVRIRKERRSTRLARTCLSFSALGAGSFASSLSADRTTGASLDIVGPSQEFVSTCDTPGGYFADFRSASSVAGVGASDLFAVGRIKLFGAGRACFEHAELYHISCDDLVEQDSVVSLVWA